MLSVHGRIPIHSPTSCGPQGLASRTAWRSTAVRANSPPGSVPISAGQDSPEGPEPVEPVDRHSAVCLVRLGRNELTSGRSMSGKSICLACLRRVHPHPVGLPDEDFAEFGLGLASNRVVAFLSRLAPLMAYSSFEALRLDEYGRLLSETRLGALNARMHHMRNSRASVLHSSYVRLIPWLYHCATTIAHHDLVNPRDHQLHYTPTNLKLGSRPNLHLHGLPVVPLPPADPLNGPAPWASHRQPSMLPTADLSVLSTLLAWSVGESDHRGFRRRMRQPGQSRFRRSLVVLARDVEGLTPGVYHYHAKPLYVLEPIRKADESQIREALHTDDLPALVLIGTGAVAKCAEKYQAFAYRLAFMDSGVTVAYLTLIADYLGISPRHYPDFDDVRTAELLGIPRCAGNCRCPRLRLRSAASTTRDHCQRLGPTIESERSRFGTCPPRATSCLCSSNRLIRAGTPA